MSTKPAPPGPARQHPAPPGQHTAPAQSTLDGLQATQDQVSDLINSRYLLEREQANLRRIRDRLTDRIHNLRRTQIQAGRSELP